MSVQNGLSESQIEYGAERIYQKYSLNVADMTLFFRNIRDGVYGEFYENLSIEKIIKWLDQYWDHRCEIAEGYGQMRHEETVSVLKKPLAPEVAKEVVDKMFKGVGEEKIDHSQKGGGVGSRKRDVLKIKLEASMADRTEEELREYLLTYDINHESHDPEIYEMVEKELDRRNST